MTFEDPLLDPRALAAFLRAHRLPPLDRFAQHFLVDASLLHEILAASNADPRVPVIEIGAGLGVLTWALAHVRNQKSTVRNTEAAPIVAVELDRRLIPLLRERVQGFSSVRIVHADILKTSLAALLPTPDSLLPRSYDVIGNLPYNLTGKIFQKFLAREPRPRRMTLLIQDDVAEAIASGPPRLGIRAISVQVYAKPRIMRGHISPSVFMPPPTVHSALVVFETRETPLVPPEQERDFFRLVRAGFSQKRKMLANALAATYRLPPPTIAKRLHAAGIEPRRRAQTLTIEDWLHLLKVWNTVADA